MDTKDIAEKLLDTIQYATIATSGIGGEPWNTPVFCAHDGYTIYWSSHPDAVHSKNIANTHKAFIAIYNSKAQEGEGVGLYLRAAVRILEGEEEIAHALDLLGKRRGKPFSHPEKFIDGGPQRIYEATPVHAWINDADQDADGDFIKDYRIELELDN